jgi:microcystin-dependent protein
MTSTPSTILRLELMGSGDQAGSWGTTTNTNLGTLLEAAIAGYVAVPIVAASQALTIVNYAADESRRAILKFTGASAATSVYAPPVSKTYVLWNATSYTITIYNSTVAGNTTAAGAGVAIAANEKVTVFSDGTNFYGTVPADTVTASRGGTGLTASGASGNVLTSNGSAWVSSTPTYVPTGGMMMWGTATAPTGYLLCDGSAVSRTTYSALFAVLGTAYGSGDGSTTFNVPDFRDRFPVGAGTTYSPNSQGGSKDAITVAHTHTGTTSTIGDHTHTVFQRGGTLGGPFQYPVHSTYIDNADYQSGAAGSHNHTFTTDSTGSSGTNANLPPYLGVYFIIKT